MANEYSGTALYVSWITAAGTFLPSSRYRTFSDDPEQELMETTAGSDADKTYIAGPRSGKCSMTFLDTAGGTALTNALASGTNGTLIFGPEGTVVGKPKRTIPAIAMGVKRSHAYGGVTEVSIEWQYNGAAVNGAY